MAGELFTLFAKLGIKDDEFNKGIKNASKKGKGLAGNLKTAFKVGAAAIGVTTGAVIGLSKAFVSGAKETAAYGDSVDKMSQRVGLSAEAYQKWDYVMKIAGTEMSNMRIGLKTLTNQLDKAKSGGKEAQENFAKLGLSMDDVNKMSREEAFGAVIKGFQGMKDSTERAALANKMFGRSGQELTPLFNQSAESTEKLIEQAEKYGIIMSDKAVKASAAWTDSLTTLSMTTQGLKNRLMGEFLPSLTQVTDGLSSLFAGDYDKGVEQISAGVENLTSKITEMLPKVLDIGGDIILNLADSIINNLPKLLDTGLDIILKIGEGIIEQAPNLLRSALQILLSLVQSITNNLQTLIPAVVSVVTEIATMLTEPDMLVNLGSAALDLIIALADGLVEATPQLIEAVPVIVMNLVSALIKLAPKLMSAAGKLMGALIHGLLLEIKGVLAAANKIKDVFVSKIGGLKDSAKTWAKDMIDSFVQGIRDRFQKIKDSFKSIADLAKSLLGHSTPDEGPMKDDDKWMPDFMNNLANGIERNKFKVQNAINDLAGDMAFDFGGYGDYESLNDTLKLELSVADGMTSGNLGLMLARMLLPYIKVAIKEGGVKLGTT